MLVSLIQIILVLIITIVKKLIYLSQNQKVYILPYIRMLYGVTKWKMAKIQIDLSDVEDKIVEAYKLVYGLKTKQEAVKQMIKHFKVKIIPEKLNKDEEYYKKALKFSEDKK